MDILEYINKMQEMYGDANERFNQADGGQLVAPSVDGSRPGYAGVKGMKNPSKQSYTPAQQKAMKEAFPDIKFDFKEYPKLGIPREINGERNVNYNKVIAFTKDRPEAPAFKSFKKDLLNQKERNLVMSNFELPEGIEKWDFDKHKFGFVAGGKKGSIGVKGYYKLKKTKKDIIDSELLRERANLIGNIKTFLKGPTPFRIVAAIGRPKGWIMNSMLRVYDNEIKSKVKNLTYEPVYKKINNKKIIIGFKDNTKAGGGKTYYGLDKYAKTNGTPWEKHGDFAKVKKFIDISKKSFNEPNEVITGLLKKGGITQTVRLNDLLNFLADRTPKQALQTAIEKHHTQGVGAKGSIGNATADLQLLDVVSNRKTREIENRIRSNTMRPGDNQALKNLGAIVQHEGKIYGSGPKTAEGGFKRIEKNVQTSLENFNKKNFKQLGMFLEKLGCGNAAGGRILMSNGGATLTKCAQKGSNKLEQIVLRGTKDKSEQALASQILKTSRVLKDLTSIKGALGPAALAFTAATEAGLVGFDMLAEGKTFREAVGDNIFNYALGPKLKIDSIKERNKRFKKLGISEEDMGKIGAYESALQGIEQFEKTFKKAETAQQRLDEANRAIDPTLFPGTINELQKNLNVARANVQDLYRAGDPYNQETGKGTLAPAINPEGLMALQKAQNLATIDKLTSRGPQIFGKIFPRAEKSRQQRILDASSIVNPAYQYQMDNLFMYPYGFAGGGIAKMAGVDQGPPPESGPMSQGLRSLYNNGRKL